MRENKVVNHVEQWLKYKNRYFINIYGSQFTKGGTPDIITHDIDGVFLAIEVKAPKQPLVLNQWERAKEILLSGGRYVVAQDDFDLDLVDSHKVSTINITKDEIENDEFSLNQYKTKIPCTKELIIK